MSDTNEPSPRPWRIVDYAKCPGLADVFDASGSPSGLVAGELKPADAALIVASVNECDRLRDIVRTVRDTIELQATFDDNGGFHLDNVPACVIAKALLREASAAIGEEKP